MTDLKALGLGLGIQKVSLKDKAVDRLRSYIISGKITPGTPLVERDVAELLAISRGPTREALLELENQGLVEVVRGRRRIIAPSTSELLEMFEVRTPLEARAAQRVATKMTEERRHLLGTPLQAMSDAVKRRDREAFVMADLALHEAIWRESSNVYLEKVLRNLSGPIFLAMLNGAIDSFDWTETFDLHEALVNSIYRGDAISAGEMAGRNMYNAMGRNESMGH